MVSEIQSKQAIGHLPAAPAPVPVTKPEAATPSSVEAPKQGALGGHLTPIPKADIKVDPERMRKSLEDAIKHLNDMMQAGNRGLNFSMDPSLEVPVVVVKNSHTGEIVRQFPNEVIIRMAHSIDEFKGMLHNKTI